MHGIEIGDYYLINYQSKVIRGVVFKYHGTENYFVISDNGRKYDVNYYNFVSKIPEEDMSLKVKSIIQKVKEIDNLEKNLEKSSKELEDVLSSLKYNNEILSASDFEKFVMQNVSNKVKYALKSPHRYKVEFIFMPNSPLIVISTSRIACSDLRRANYDFIDNFGTGYFVKSVNSPTYLKLKEKEDKEGISFANVSHPLIRFMTSESRLDVEFGTNTLKYYSGCTLALNAFPLTEDNALEIVKILNEVIRIYSLSI